MYTRLTQTDLVLDWTDLDQVRDLHTKLGGGMVIVKYHTRNNYNICSEERAAELLERDAIKVIER